MACEFKQQPENQTQRVVLSKNPSCSGFGHRGGCGAVQLLSRLSAAHCLLISPLPAAKEIDCEFLN